jgi:hypothetical protein
MKWTKKEHNAITATLEHWKDDVIPAIKNNDALPIGASNCPFCLLIGLSCLECPYFKAYHKACNDTGEIYEIFYYDQTIENAINCYNKVADMINTEHYKED